jgi:hypothetical protein
VVAPNHFYFGLGEYQSENPKADNYITVKTSRPGVELVADTFEVSGMFSGRLQAGYLPRPFFRVAKGQLEPGDRITVTFGDRSGGSRGLKLIHWSNSAIRFPVWILTEPGGLLLTPTEIAFRTVGGPAVAVAGFAPSVLAVDEPFSLTVRSEDVFRNLATGRAPAYRLMDNGRPLRDLPASDRTLTTVDGLRFATPGVHRLTFETADGRVAGRANPILVEANPGERIYWGETHGHCGYSEGMGQADDYFRFAATRRGSIS